MLEKVPFGAYNRPLTSFEDPRLLGRLPNRNTTIDAFNRGFALLELRGQDLQVRADRGGFTAFTPDETATYLDYQRVRHGRSNLNAANLVAQINQTEAQGTELTPLQRNIRVLYQEGNFHQIPGTDHPLSASLTEQRYVIPVRDGDPNFAILDGAPVDGIVRELDRRIGQQATRTPSSIVDRIRRFADLRRLRHDRDVLYTQSSLIYQEDKGIAHARNQYEAKLKHEDPRLSELQDLDWYKSELDLRNRRVLNLPCGRNRWGCLLIPLVGLALLPVLCTGPATPIPTLVETPSPTPVVSFTPISEKTPVPTSTPEAQPRPKPVTIIRTNPCEDIPGGQLRLEVFNGSINEKPSVEGHNQRELAFLLSNWDQRTYKPNDDAEMLARLARFSETNPELVYAYLQVALKDELRTAQKIRGDQEQDPFLGGTDFGRSLQILASCTNPDQRIEKAISIVGLQ